MIWLVSVLSLLTWLAPLSPLSCTQTQTQEQDRQLNQNHTARYILCICFCFCFMFIYSLFIVSLYLFLLVSLSTGQARPVINISVSCIAPNILFLYYMWLKANRHCLHIERKYIFQTLNRTGVLSVWSGTVTAERERERRRPIIIQHYLVVLDSRYWVTEWCCILQINDMKCQSG